MAPRVVLQAPILLAHDDTRQLGPADLCCTGLGVLLRVAPPLGAPVTGLLPPDVEEEEGLVVSGRVVAKTTPLRVIGPGARDLPMHTCVACGWTAPQGEPLDVGAPRTRAVPARLSARAAQLAFPDPGAPTRCPACQAFSPIAVEGALHRVSVRLELPCAQQARQLRGYLERAIEASGGAVPERRRDPSRNRWQGADGALEIERSVETGEAVRWTFPRGPDRGVLRFVDGRDLALGTRVRLVLRGSAASSELDLEARIEAITFERGRKVYLGSFAPTASSSEEVRRFVAETSSRARRLAPSRRRWFRLG